MVVIKIGNTFFNIDKNVFSNILALKEIVLPFEWHNFCILIDFVKNQMKFYHNKNIQAIQNFTIAHQDTGGIRKLMTKGHLGGNKFLGSLTDFHIFGAALSEESVLEWISCKYKESCFSFCKEFIQFSFVGVCLALLLKYCSGQNYFQI